MKAFVGNKNKSQGALKFKVTTKFAVKEKVPLLFLSEKWKRQIFYFFFWSDSNMSPIVYVVICQTLDWSTPLTCRWHT